MAKRLEYRFKIDAFDPETMPMASLAEYLADLAKLLGSKDAVHFDRVEEGSVECVVRAEQYADARIEERLQSVDSDPDVRKIYRRLNERLRKHSARGTLTKSSAKILTFPGRDTDREIVKISQPGSVVGELVRVGGVDKTAHAVVQLPDGDIVSCKVNRTLARQLSQEGCLYGDPIRLTGRARWERRLGAEWVMVSFTASQFEFLKPIDLDRVFEELAELPGNLWRDEPDPERALREIRYGDVGGESR